MAYFNKINIKILISSILYFHSLILVYGMFTKNHNYFLWYFFVSFCLIITLIFREKKSEEFLHSSIASIILVVIALYISINTIDFSFDGNAYHIKAIRNIASGVNLFFEKNIESYIQSYPKGSWMVGAALYKITGLINLTKIFNILIPIVGVILVYQALKSILKYNGTIENKSNNFYLALASVLVIFSPLNIVQILSNLNDLTASAALYSGLAILILITIGGWDKRMCIVAVYSLLFSAVCKFNFLPIALLAYLIIIYILYRNNNIIMLIISVALMCLFLYDPYILNYIYHDNIFYPILGASNSASVDPISIASPWGQDHKNQLEFIRFIQAMFLEYNGDKFKLPWTFNLSEIKQLGRESTVGSGYGIFSGLIFILIFGTIIFSKVENKYKLILSIILLGSIQYPGSSFARYAFLYPGSVLFGFILFYCKKIILPSVKLLIIILTINLSISFIFGMANQVIRKERLEYILNHKDNILIGTQYFSPDFLDVKDYETIKTKHGIYIKKGCFYNKFGAKNLLFLKSCDGERIL